MGGEGVDMLPAAEEIVSVADVVTYDARGTFARTPLPADRQRMVHHMADLAHVIDATCGGRSFVAGVSMGAAVALALAAQSPARVMGVALVAPGFDPEGRLAPGGRRYIDYTARLVRKSGFDAIPLDPSTAAWRRRFAPEGLLALWDGFPDSVEPAPAGRVSASALVIGWPGDLLHPLEIARAWADHLHAPLVELPPPDESSIRRAGQATAQFIREVCS